MDPERADFNLTQAHRDELSEVVRRVEAEDKIRATVGDLHFSLVAFAKAVREAQDAYHNPLDVGASPGLMAALKAWENAQQEG